MSRETVLAAGRTAAAEGMVDTCTISRLTGTSTDPDDGTVTETTTTIYEGACRIQQLPAIARPAHAGEALVYQQPYQLQLPMDGTEGIEVPDRVLVTASLDSDLVGRRFWVKALAHKTHATARRVGLEEVTS